MRTCDRCLDGKHHICGSLLGQQCACSVCSAGRGRRPLAPKPKAKPQATRARRSTPRARDHQAEYRRRRGDQPRQPAGPRPKMDEQIRELVEAGGLTQEQIAEQVGMSRKGVQRAIKRMGLEHTKVAYRRPDTLAEDEIDLALVMRSTGGTYAEIGAALGRSHSTIHRALQGRPNRKVPHA